MTSSRALPQNLGISKIRKKCTKFLEKIRQKGLTFWMGRCIMIKRQDRRNYVCMQVQTAMKPEIAAKAGNFGGVSPTIGRQRK